MSYTSGDLWGAIYDIGHDEPTVPDIAPDIIERLIELKAVERKATGLPILTAFGDWCRSLMDSGDDYYVLGLDDPEKAGCGLPGVTADNWMRF